MHENVPVITVDGPSGSGKGTISFQLAKELNWHFLDSGALYRVLGLAASHHSVALDNDEALCVLAAHLDVHFKKEKGGAPRIILEGQDVTTQIRTESCGRAASMVGAIGAVRQSLLDRQKAFLESPGLVADGRDMGTVVFPDAKLKFFLEASIEVRAQRRFEQLKENGVQVVLETIINEISERDERDRKRAVAPMVPAQEAIIIDTTFLSINQVFDRVWQQVKESLVQI